jgi:DNA-binding response OmpR family regulator
VKADAQTKLLLIEDDLPLAELVVEFLTSHDFDVTAVDSAAKLKSISTSNSFQLIVCDLMLPDIHGFQLIKLLKTKYDCPLIFLTANSDDESQITGLELGAIDYIIKPVDPRLLLARINTALRSADTLDTKSDTISIGSLELNRKSFNTRYNNKRIHLTNHEFELLWIFAINHGKTLDRDFLFQHTIGREYNGLDRTLDGRISRLRKKLDDLNIPSLTIKTIWGKGYLFNLKQRP